MQHSRWYIEDTGNLIIRDVNSEDDGSYTCVASNLAGVRKSKPIQLATQCEFLIFFGNLNSNLVPILIFALNIIFSSAPVHDPSAEGHDSHGRLQYTVTV